MSSANGGIVSARGSSLTRCSAPLQFPDVRGSVGAKGLQPYLPEFSVRQVGWEGLLPVTTFGGSGYASHCGVSSRASIRGFSLLSNVGAPGVRASVPLLHRAVFFLVCSQM